MTDQTTGTDRLSSFDEPEDAGGLAFKDYVAIVRRRLWVMIAAFVIVVTLGTVWVFKTTATFQAVAKILIEHQAPRATTFEEVVQLPAAEQNYYRTQAELLKSRAVMERALEDRAVSGLPEVTGQNEDRPSLASATIKAMAGARPAKPREPWERLRNCLKIDPVKRTQLIEVKAESTSAKRAALMANAVATAFEAYCLERRLAVSGEAFRFLREQKDEQEKELRAAEDALQAFRETAKAVSLDVSDKANPILHTLGQLNEQLTLVRLKRTEHAARFTAVRAALEASDGAVRADDEAFFSLPDVRADAMIGELRSELLTADKDAATVAATYGPAHPQAQTAHAAVALVRTKLQTCLAQLVASRQTELDTLQNEERELERQYEEQNRVALGLAAKSLAFNRLEHETTRQRKLFDILVERMREVDLTNDYAKGNVQVVEPASVPRTPHRPRKALVVLLSALLGLGLSLGAAFFFEYVDDTVKTPEDLEERVGLPVLGFVPEFEGSDEEREQEPHGRLLALLEPSSQVTEAYRSIRTNLFYSAPAEESRVVVVTSGGPGDGKTTSAANLAVVIAQSGKRVLLLDADLRRPMVRATFGLKSGQGLTSVLVGEATFDEAVAQPVCDGEIIENLHILPSGPKPPNPAELLACQAMRDLLERVRGQYDRIIIDTPPALFVADTSIVAAISDGVILVVRSGVNPRSMVMQAKDQLLGVGARLLGSILNSVYLDRLTHYYSKYSYYGYSGYYKDYSKGYYRDDGLDALDRDLEEVEDDLDSLEASVDRAGAAPPQLPATVSQ